MSEPPTAKQITAALKRAADAARDLTPHPERILRHPHCPRERIDARWWLVGHLRVLGQAQE